MKIRMQTYLLKSVLKGGLILFVAIILFSLLRLSPLSIQQQASGITASPALIAQMPTTIPVQVDAQQGVLQAEASPGPGSPAPETSPAASSGGSLNAGSIAPLTLLVRPKKDVKDTYIINKATAVASGTGDGSFSGTGTAPPGQPIPSGDVAVVKEKLCKEYLVCATENTYNPPDQAWTLPQITALWNVVQRIYQSPLYQSLAMRNEKLEVTRAACYPQPGGTTCDDTWGYYAGHSYTNWNTMDGTRLVVMTNNIPKDGPIAILEWVMAHEIGHSASIDSVNDNTKPSQPLIDCRQAVSGYADDYGQEYLAETISYYMTTAEEAHDGYKGTSSNIKQDFPCIYDAAKKEFFGGVEY